MVEALWMVFKILLLILGILTVAGIIFGLIIAPIKRRKQKEALEKFANELEKIANECIEELAKEQESKKKTTKKTTKKKEN